MVSEAPGWMRAPRTSEDTGKKVSRTKSQNTLTFSIRQRKPTKETERRGGQDGGLEGQR